MKIDKIKLILASIILMLISNISRNNAQSANFEYDKKLLNLSKEKELEFKGYAEKIKKSYDSSASSTLDTLIKEVNGEEFEVESGHYMF